MTVARVLACVIAALAFCVFGYGIHAMRHTNSTSTLAALEHRVAELERRLPQATDSQPPGFDESIPQSGSARTASPGMPASTSDSVMGRRSMSTAEMARGRKARITELDAAFRRDLMDAAGARQAEGELAEAASADDLVESGTTPIAIDMQCRSTRCRVIARFAADSDAEGWAGLYMLSAARTLAGADTVITPQADGTIELAIYGTRK